MATLNIRVRFVPGGCTGELQPLPGCCSERYCEKRKEEKIDRQFTRQIQEALGKLEDLDNVSVKFNSQTMKRKSTKWLIQVVKEIRRRSDYCLCTL